MSFAFPEAEYRPHAAYADAYDARVALGRDRAAGSTVAICACARDIAANAKVKRLRGELKPKPKKNWPSRKFGNG